MGDVIYGVFKQAAANQSPSTIKAIDNLLISLNGIADSFDQDALMAVAAASARHRPGLAGHKDMRHLPFFTLSGNAEALVVRPDRSPDNEDGFVLSVASPDVAWYVRPEGLLDALAMERGFQIRLAERCIPILPPMLMERYCSFPPGEDRLAVVKTLRLTSEGRPFGPLTVDRAIISCHDDISFQQADEYLCGNDNAVVKALHHPFNLLEPVYMALYNDAEKRGELSFEQERITVVATEDGRVGSFKKEPRLFSEDIREKIIVAVNAAAAQRLSNYPDLHVLYRAQEKPIPRLLPRRMSPAQHMNAQSAYAVETLKSSAGATIGKGYFHEQARPHYGLALEQYLQVICPTESYGDIINQRALLKSAGYDTDISADLPDNFVSMMNTRKSNVGQIQKQAVQSYALAWIDAQKGKMLEARLISVKNDAITLHLNGCPYKHVETPSNLQFLILKGWLDRATPEEKGVFQVKILETDLASGRLKLGFESLGSIKPPLETQRKLDIG